MLDASMVDPDHAARSFPQNIVLAGITGSGKSTVGKHLALLLGMGFLDLDELIERNAGKSILKIFEEGGEALFRELEAKAIESIADIKSHVVGLGGGALQNERCFELAHKIGPIVWLRPSPDEVARRLHLRVSELEKRPLFKDLVSIEKQDERRQAIRDRVTGLLRDREPMFSRADIVLDGGYVTPETSAHYLKEILTSEGLVERQSGRFASWHPLKGY